MVTNYKFFVRVKLFLFDIVLRTSSKPNKAYWVLDGDVNGALHGGFQIAENIATDGFKSKKNNSK